MADNASNNKTGILAKAQRQLARTKTKVLQNLGKAEKTTDDIVNDYVTKVDKQQESGQHVQKELKNYVHCVRNLCQASKSLHTCLSQTYEEEWTEEPLFKEQMKAFDLLWTDYAQNVHESLNTMQSYLQSFPTLKNKVSKRGRKMVDFDNARHHMEVMQGAKKKDEVKIQKAQDDLNEAKRIYEQMNTELHTELPEFYNSRVSFYASLFTNVFGSEFVFHSEMGKTYGTLGDIAQKLSKEYEQFVYQPRVSLDKSLSTHSSAEFGVNGDSSSAPTTPVVSNAHTVSVSSPTIDSPEPVYSNQEAMDASQANRVSDGSQINGENKVGESTPEDSPVVAHVNDKEDDKVSKDRPKQEHADDDDDEGGNVYEEPKDPLPTTDNHASGEAADDDDENEPDDVYSGVPSNKPLYNSPPDSLYTVEATHKYQGEDEDELNFESGEIIHVVEYEHPDEQDDGWQMGVRQSDGKRGVFPENFTRRVLE